MAANSYNLLLFSSLDLPSLPPSLPSLSLFFFVLIHLLFSQPCYYLVASFPPPPPPRLSSLLFTVRHRGHLASSPPSFFFIQLLLFPRFPRALPCYLCPSGSRIYVPASRACLCLICLPLHFTHPRAPPPPPPPPISSTPCLLRPSCISLLSFSLHPLDLYSSSLASPLTSPLRLRPSSGFHQHPGERVTLTTTIRKGTYIQREATHSPVRVQGKLRRSRICTGTVHQRRPPSRTRPATETENMGAIVLRPLPIFFFRFFLLFFSF